MSLLWGVLGLGFLGSVIGPLILSSAASRQVERSHLLERQRHDELARRLVQKQDEIARLAAAFMQQLTETREHSALHAREDAAAIAGQLGQIYGLVNSTLTSALEAQLSALEGQLVLMRRVVALEAEGTGHPSADLTVGIETTMEEIRLLRLRLTNRADSTQAGLDLRASLTHQRMDR
jgi:hypothetical protein